MATRVGDRIAAAAALRRVGVAGAIVIGLLACGCGPVLRPARGGGIEVLANVQVTVPGVVTVSGTPGDQVTVTAQIVAGHVLPLVFEPAFVTTTNDFLVYAFQFQPMAEGYVETQTARTGATGYAIDLRHFRKADTSSSAVYVLASRGTTRLMVRVDATGEALSDAEAARLVAFVLAVLDTAT
jgi:hypothetical protein